MYNRKSTVAFFTSFIRVRELNRDLTNRDLTKLDTDRDEIALMLTRS